MPDPLSKMERRILDFLIDYLKRNTYQPSIREIGRRFGIKSTKTVSEYLQSLADKGHIEREASRSRAVRIVGLELQNANAVTVPYYGRIAAGQPASIGGPADAEFSLDPKLVRAAGSFVLEVQGESMEAMGILDGDLVVVEPAGEEAIRNGEIVAARVDGGATVKRYFEREGGVVLEPANPDFAPILVTGDGDLDILGRVTGLFRRFTTQQVEAVGG